MEHIYFIKKLTCDTVWHTDCHAVVVAAVHSGTNTLRHFHRNICCCVKITAFVNIVIKTRVRIFKE